MKNATTMTPAEKYDAALAAAKLAEEKGLSQSTQNKKWAWL